MSQVLEPHDAVLGEGVDLSDGDHVGEDVAEPLRIHSLMTSTTWAFRPLPL